MGTLSNLPMPGSSVSDVKLASDGRNLDNLKRSAGSDPKGAAREAMLEMADGDGRARRPSSSSRCSWVSCSRRCARPPRRPA